MLTGMTNTTKTPGFGQSVLNALKKHWFPLLVAVIAIVFITQNRDRTSVSFLPFDLLTVNIALWLALAVAAVLGLVIGLFLKR